MSDLLVAIAIWCKADPSPFKSVQQCRQQLLQCVTDKTKRDPYATCFEQPDDLKWPNWNKETIR